MWMENYKKIINLFKLSICPSIFHSFSSFPVFFFAGSFENTHKTKFDCKENKKKEISGQA